MSVLHSAVFRHAPGAPQSLSIYLSLQAEHGNGTQHLPPRKPTGDNCHIVQFSKFAQNNLNPPSDQKLEMEIKIGDTILRLHDWIVQTINNSDTHSIGIGTIVWITSDSSVAVQI